MITFISFLKNIPKSFLSTNQDSFYQDCPCGYPSQHLRVKDMNLIKSNYKTKSLKIQLTRLFMNDYFLRKFI